jgi:hypothetical protein
MFIKEIFEGKKSEELHNEFLKFGRGEFRNKYLIEAKKQKDRWNIKTSNEFANLLVGECLKESSEKISIKGIIISTFDLRNETKIQISDVKQFMGIKQSIIDTEIDKNDLIELMAKFPRIFYALSFTTPYSELKIKAKAPKSAKPSTSGEKEVRADFCSLKTSNKEIIRQLFFDVHNFNEVKVNHTIQVEDIIYPRGEKNPITVRENSIRKGKIIRIIDVSGKREERTANFEG